MPRILIVGLVLGIVICVFLTSGCSKETIIVNNTSSTPTILATPTLIIPTLIPNIGDDFLTLGYVNLGGKTVAGAEVEAISADGAYHFRNITNDNGAYVLYLPKNVLFNVTARYQGLRHTLWPVSVGDHYYEYNISITTYTKSFIEGTGYSVGGYLGYNNSQPLTGFTFNVTPVNSNATLTAVIKEDWSYTLEVEPGVMYHLERWRPSVIFNYRNSDLMSDVVAGPNETALIDYVVVLP